MTDYRRETTLTEAFVSLADTLVQDFDLLDMLRSLLETCIDVLDVEAAGLLLKTEAGELQVVASTSEDANFVELVQLGAHAGPCVECVATGKPVVVPDITDTVERWPAFARAALDRGFRSLQATPLRLRQDVIGTMNLLGSRAGALNERDVAAAQALSDVATIGILTHRSARRKELIAAQLQTALDTRVIIEQAKGIIAQSTGLSMQDGFVLLRSFARRNRLSVNLVATELIGRRMRPLDLVEVREQPVPKPSGGCAQRQT